MEGFLTNLGYYDTFDLIIYFIDGNSDHFLDVYAKLSLKI